jgi:hypothetical protein
MWGYNVDNFYKSLKVQRSKALRNYRIKIIKIICSATMGQYSEAWLCYGICVNLHKSNHKQIRKLMKIIKKIYDSDRMEPCYSDFFELDDSHKHKGDEVVDYEYDEELIKKILGIDEKSNIQVIFQNDWLDHHENVFIGVKLKCLCDVKSGYGTVRILQLPLHEIIKEKEDAQSKYCEQINSIAKLLFSDKIDEPDIVFVSDIE